MDNNNMDMSDSDYETEEETFIYLPLEGFEETNIFNDKNISFEFNNLSSLGGNVVESNDKNEDNISLTLKEGMELSGEMNRNCGSLLFFQDQAASDSVSSILSNSEITFVGSSINVCPLKLKKLLVTNNGGSRATSSSTS